MTLKFGITESDEVTLSGVIMSRATTSFRLSLPLVNAQYSNK